MKEKQKRKQAAALSYQPEWTQAPQLIAKGKGKVAEQILEQARKHGITIQEDPALVELLGNLEINEKIPEELYRAVAEVFAFIYQLDQQKQN